MLAASRMFLRIASVVSCLILAACSGGGGGGGGNSSATAAPTIVAGVISFPATNVPDGFVSAGFNTAVSVSVQDSSGGAPITNASVSVNTLPLAYNSAYQDYEGEISLNPAGSVSLSITVGSTTYTASGAQFTSYPTITSPLAGVTWLSPDSNLVAWSGVAPPPNSLYTLGITDTNGQLLWPTGNSYQVLPTTTTSYTIGPYSLTAGNRLVIVGLNKLVDIPDADPNSGLVIGGYNYVPITVINRQIATLLSIAVTPTNPTITVGKTQQLAATGNYSDGSSQDLTTQVNWLSSDSTKATVSKTGLVTGQTAGSTIISATYGGISGSTSVTVFQQNPVSISVTPNNPTVISGNTLQLTATGNYADSSTQDLTTMVTWQSSDPTKVKVSTSGLITGQSAGSSATISATYGGISGSTSVNVFQPNPSPAPPLSQSVTYQIDYAHSGTAVFPGPIAFPSDPTWSVTLNGAISYPLIADGMVYVTTSGPNSGNNYVNYLYALDEQTGSIVWGPVTIPTGYLANWSTSAYDHGKIFVLSYDGLLSSFDAATGKAGWSAQMTGQYYFSGPPTAVNGIVYVAGAESAGTLYAVDESNGSVLWTTTVWNGDRSSATVSSDGVFVSYPCQVYKFDPITGVSLWHFSGPCEGAGGATPVYANGLLYVRDPVMSDIINPIDPPPPGYIYDATSGTQVGTFTAGPMPAIGPTTGFFQNSGTLQAVDLASHNAIWSFAGDNKLVSAPIVINQDVIVGSGSGNVYAVDAVTGLQIWSGNAGSAISAPDEQYVYSQPLTGFGAGEGYLVVPAGNVLTAWKLSGP